MGKDNTITKHKHRESMVFQIFFILFCLSLKTGAAKAKITLYTTIILRFVPMFVNISYDKFLHIF